MLNLRLVLCLVFLALAEANNSNYIRGEKVNPASRVINEKSDVGARNDILEFRKVERLTGSKPVQNTQRSPKTHWF